MKKLLTVFMILLLVATGCSSNNANGNEVIVTEITEPVEIVFWHAMNGAQEEALTKVTQDFMTANPLITVRLQNQSSYSDLQQKITSTLVSVDNLPNITQAFPGYIYDATVDGLIVPIRQYIDHEIIGITDYDTDVIEGFRNTGIINDVQYGMPFNKSTEVTFYNKTLLDELGLQAPTNLEEFKAIAKAVSEQKPGVVGAGFDALNNYYSQYLMSEGVLFDKELDPTSLASRNAVEYYLDGIKNGYFRIAGSERYLSGAFGSQTLAMYVGSVAGESFVRKGAEGKFEPVATKSPFKNTIQQGTDVFMFAKSTPEQKTASFLFMKHLISPEATLYFAQKTGYLPVRTSVINSDAYKNSDSLIAPIADEITQGMFTIPTVENSNAAYQGASTQLEAILANPNEDLTTGLERFKAELNALWNN